VDRHFHEDLRGVIDRLSAMGALVESQAREAVAALAGQLSDVAVRVVDADAAVNAMELELDDLCFKALALQHPVASDLRVIRSVMKANTDLERIGDQAVNMAHAVIDLSRQPPLRLQPEVLALADVALSMLHDSLGAFVDQDIIRARDVLERDDEADGLRDTLLQRLLEQMRADPDTLHLAQGLILIVRSLERIADHATNIAEDLIFLVDGRDIRHSRGHVM
jgi:phosphate transport system protein